MGLPPKVCVRGGLTVQFLVILSFSCRDTFRVVAEGPILPVSFENFSQKAETALSAALGQKLLPSNPVREAEVFRAEDKKISLQPQRAAS
jgi:hypothetical protein